MNINRIKGVFLSLFCIFCFLTVGFSQTNSTNTSNCATNQISIEPQLNAQLSELFSAIYSRNTNRVKAELKAGASPNERDQFGNTPLISISLPFIGEPDERNLSPRKQKNLREQRATAQTAIFNELLKYKADINSQNQHGVTALMILAHRGSAENMLKLMNLLIKNNVQINIQDKEGYTALMHGVEVRNSNIVSLLLKNGAKTDLKNCMDKTAFDLATGQPKILKILQNRKN